MCKYCEVDSIKEIGMYYFLKGEKKRANYCPTCGRKLTADKIPYKVIVDYLNNATGKNFRSGTEKTQKHIRARFRDGFTQEDFEKVIDCKTKEWLGSKYEKYLRPETLFGTKFESYLQSKSADTEDWGDVL